MPEANALQRNVYLTYSHEGWNFSTRWSLVRVTQSKAQRQECVRGGRVQMPAPKSLHFNSGSLFCLFLIGESTSRAVCGMWIFALTGLGNPYGCYTVGAVSSWLTSAGAETLARELPPNPAAPLFMCSLFFLNDTGTGEIDGMVGKVLAAQARIPEFRSPDSIWKAGAVTHIWNPSVWGVGRKRRIPGRLV